MPYKRLRHYLQTPRRIIVDPLRRDCNPPEDPDWPTPTSRSEVGQLVHRLPHWAQVVCAVTAAEMVLPIWEEWTEGVDNLTREEEEAPSQAIEAAWQWLDEETPETQEAAYEAAHTAWAAAWVAGGVAGGVADADAYNADANATADAAAWGAWVAGGGGVVLDAANSASYAVDAAAWATARGEVARAEFYNEWWKLCRCRLAFILEVRL